MDANNEKTFVDFISESLSDVRLLVGFLSKCNEAQDKKNVDILKAWFEGAGFRGISQDDCEKLMTAQEGLLAGSTPDSY
jgi:hypothetical protein